MIRPSDTFAGPTHRRRRMIAATKITNFVFLLFIAIVTVTSLIVDLHQYDTIHQYSSSSFSSLLSPTATAFSFITTAVTRTRTTAKIPIPTSLPLSLDKFTWNVVSGFRSRYQHQPLMAEPDIVSSNVESQQATNNDTSDTADKNDNTDLDTKQQQQQQQQQKQQEHNDLMYVLGMNVARQIGDIRPLLVNVTNDIQYVTNGIVDTIIGRLSEQDQLLLLQQYQTTLNTFIQQRALVLQEKLVQAGNEMLQLMAETDGAITLQPSNVVVHVLSSSASNSSSTTPRLRPTKTSIVRMHYHGTLADGTIFDSSLLSGGNNEKNEPINVPLMKLVPGLREGMIQQLQEGDVAMIGIPPEMGYGIITTPPNPNIPNNSTLFYKIQLYQVLTAGIDIENDSGRSSTFLVNANGTPLSSKSKSSSILLGPNGRPL